MTTNEMRQVLDWSDADVLEYKNYLGWKSYKIEGDNHLMSYESFSSYRRKPEPKLRAWKAEEYSSIECSHAVEDRDQLKARVAELERKAKALDWLNTVEGMDWFSHCDYGDATLEAIEAAMKGIK